MLFVKDENFFDKRMRIEQAFISFFDDDINFGFWINPM